LIPVHESWGPWFLLAAVDLIFSWFRAIWGRRCAFSDIFNHGATFIIINNLVELHAINNKSLLLFYLFIKSKRIIKILLLWLWVDHYWVLRFTNSTKFFRFVIRVRGYILWCFRFVWILWLALLIKLFCNANDLTWIRMLFFERKRHIEIILLIIYTLLLVLSSLHIDFIILQNQVSYLDLD
jgi:hypothetical protein